MDMASGIALAVFAAVNLAAAASGAIFTPGPWYQELKKPGWTPPNWAFPLVWTILYAANAWSGWLVWESAGTEATLALTIYGASLVFNAAWSALFFGLRRMDWALIDVSLLWASVFAVMLVFDLYSTTAALLQIPYLVWVTIAAALNLRVLQLNRAAT